MYDVYKLKLIINCQTNIKIIVYTQTHYIISFKIKAKLI